MDQTRTIISELEAPHCFLITGLREAFDGMLGSVVLDGILEVDELLCIGDSANLFHCTNTE